MTIERLRWLLAKAVADFGDRPVGELRPQEIAARRIALSPGYRVGLSRTDDRLRRYRAGAGRPAPSKAR